MMKKKRIVTATLIFALGFVLLGWGVQDWINGYKTTWLLPFPSQILWGIADIAAGYYVLKGGSWKDLFIHF